MKAKPATTSAVTRQLRWRIQASAARIAITRSGGAASSTFSMASITACIMRLIRLKNGPPFALSQSKPIFDQRPTGNL